MLVYGGFGVWGLGLGLGMGMGMGMGGWSRGEGLVGMEGMEGRGWVGRWEWLVFGRYVEEGLLEGGVC